ncbi:MAG: glycosyltransferase family 2 protein [Candidatus Levybacteria bacterium]|nr:glycosyltransferase family 2 protein [Candidatus Levybacteria bacterium]
MSTAIIVLHYGSVEDTLSCLKSLSQLKNARDVTVYVVDNGTGRLTPNIVKKVSKNARLIRNKRNLGYAAGNNSALKIALKNGHEYFLVLNNDAIADPMLLVALEPMLRKKDVGVVGCIITYAKSKKIWFAGGILNRYFCFTRHKRMDIYGDEKNRPSEEVDFITGAALLTKREVFEKIGLLPEEYFLYWEDVDFCYKARQAGYKCVIVNKHLVQHSVSAASGQRGSNKLSPVRAYYYVRNPFIFMKKYPLSLLTALMGQLCIRLPHSVLMVSSARSFREYINGLVDGIEYLMNTKPLTKKSIQSLSRT